MDLSYRTIGHEAILEKKEAYGISEGFLKFYRLGGDDRSRSLTCIILVFLPKHIAHQYLSEKSLFTTILSSNQIK